MADNDIPPKNDSPFLLRRNGNGNGHPVWISWTRQIIAFALGALSAAYIVGGKTEILNNALIRIGRLENTTERMDAEGTKRSHWKDDDQERLILENRQAIIDIKQRIEPIGVMQFKIENLEKKTIGESIREATKHP